MDLLTKEDFLINYHLTLSSQKYLLTRFYELVLPKIYLALTLHLSMKLRTSIVVFVTQQLFFSKLAKKGFHNSNAHLRNPWSIFLLTDNLCVCPQVYDRILQLEHLTILLLNLYMCVCVA